MTVDEVAEVLNGGLEGEALRKFLTSVGHYEEEEFEGDWDIMSKPGGVDVVGDAVTRKVTTVYFYLVPNNNTSPGYEPYRGELPFDLHRAQDRAAVRAAMPGEPDFTSNKHEAWDLPEFRLVVMYRKDRVVEVAVTTAR